LLVSELMKVLTRQSKDFWKAYKKYTDEVIENLKKWSVDTEYYEQEISKAIENVSKDATELQKAENLMKGLKFLGLWNRQVAKEFLAEEPIEENIKTIAIPFTQYADWFIRTYIKCCYDVLKSK
jgi:Txe/YoeB family toxin of Txe-Axe toxin-antitoxin module